MNVDVEMSWPEVSADQLRAVLDTLDYSREGWANAIIYSEKPTGRRIAFELSQGRPEDRKARYFLHPGLKQAGVITDVT